MIDLAHYSRTLQFLLLLLLSVGRYCFADDSPFVFDVESGASGTGASDQTASAWVGATGFHAATSAQLDKKAYLFIATSGHFFGPEKFLYVVAIWPNGEIDDKAERGLSMNVSGNASVIRHKILSERLDLKIEGQYTSINSNEHLMLDGKKYSLDRGRVFLVTAGPNAVEVKQQATPQEGETPELNARRYTRAWSILDGVVALSKKTTREDSVIAPVPTEKSIREGGQGCD